RDKWLFQTGRKVADEKAQNAYPKYHCFWRWSKCQILPINQLSCLSCIIVFSFFSDPIFSMFKANFFTVLVYERGEPNRTGVLENKVLVDVWMRLKN
ncbi:MAG: hypothetical protein P8L17_03590, partial [Methylophilaceae bacterium]|nr:hypothetical protein [Methylophilaceae bacterium]